MKVNDTDPFGGRHKKRRKRKDNDKRTELSFNNVIESIFDKDGHRIHIKCCWACGHRFEAKRMDALACRPSCNTALFRYANRGGTPVSPERMKELIKKLRASGGHEE